MFIADALNGLFNLVGTVYCYIVYTLALLGVAVFFVGGIVAIVCHEPKEDEADGDELEYEQVRK